MKLVPSEIESAHKFTFTNEAVGQSLGLCSNLFLIINHFELE